MGRLQRASFGLAVCALAALSCGGSDDPAAPPADPPVVSGVGATVVSPGDTLVIMGSRFETPAGENRVRFSNPLAVKAPFAGSATEVSVVVDRDATSGTIAVTSNDLTAAGPALEVQRAVGEVFVYGGLGAGQPLALPNPTPGTQYLVVPHATNPNAPYTPNYSYLIASTLAPPAVPAGETGPAGTITAREAFEAWRWEQTRELVARAGFPRAEEAAAAPEALQEFRSFNVLKTTTGDVRFPSSYQRVTAELRYTGSKCLVYADIDTLATGNLAQSDLDAIGQAFDGSIESTNVTYFGGYSDIDGNGKMLILISPVVNNLTPNGNVAAGKGFIAGFFLSIDLYSPPSVPSGTTNRAEIIYLIAADPGGFWGNAFPVAATAQENVNTTAHEHQHLISFSRRLLVERGSAQETWLEEGMAHMAEHLNGIDDANRNRGARYLADPGNISLEDNSATLEQRGGIYLFLQLMVDRYGTDILKSIVQSKCTGRACVQNVTGAAFYDLFAEFLAALYLTGRGITSDPRFNFDSIDLADFGSLATASHVAGLADVGGSVRRTAGDFHIFSGTLGDETTFTFTNPGGGAGLRHVVVRIQ
jgi:hypothetical protein